MSNRAALLPILSLCEITRSFPGVKALAGVNLELHPGEVHALMGENGAGKSTLMRVIGGILPPDSGSMTLRGQPYRPRSPRDSKAAGIAFIQQELTLVAELSVAENLQLGRMPHRLGWVDRRELKRRAQAALDFLEIELPLDQPARTLNVGQGQMLEIARALQDQADVLIMDEPTAALSQKEAEHLFSAIRRLRAQGSAIIYISHRMEEVYDLSDRLSVLRDGATTGTWAMSQITPQQVVAQMVGRELEDSQPGPRPEAGPAVLEVKGLTRHPLVKDVSFQVKAGEVVGLAGLVGAGRTEIARLIAGADPLQAGQIQINGKAVRLASPAGAIAHGVGLVPEDRKHQGLVLGMSVQDNVSFAVLKSLAQLGWLSPQKCAGLADRYIQEMRIRTPSRQQAVGTLSGGNQQKVVMGKWLARDCKLLILDEPTRGVDVGAKAEIYRLIEEQVAAGKAVLLISSELPELLRLSTRVLVISAGRLVAEYSREEATPEKILASALAGLA
ncbi:MAG: sugar ABC transporter ATP-binding protein [Candidatus Eremiobacteraeota bacterium]|nr:sugar ABC transporter ATP-binding protein [Candidatus Eremiobacteraeota bacterium]MCW5866827.1 sugar ABC transporter ATP-binding protein [Candidatus Eremiobacteraeota bacterium]